MLNTLWIWIMRNLFSSKLNCILTILILTSLLWLIPPLIDWFLLSANFSGHTKADCISSGACWPFVTERLHQFIYGFYPEMERWRVNVAGGWVVIAGLTLWVKRFSIGSRLILGVIFLLISLSFMIGGVGGLDYVSTEQWGGLSLTLVLAISSIICSFPIALLLALGRRSSLILIKSFCVVFIEVTRGVPLISVLFMASVMLPLFLPVDVDINKLFRAFLGITFFQAAYLAEVIRGGLQGIPQGQYDAAKALGFKYWKYMGLIILPQALKMMIPGIVNSFIALFKDTTLVLVIGLFDFLGIIQAATTDSEWLGLALEGYVFCAMVYWAFCYGLSFYSKYLEKKLNTGVARD